LCSRLLIFTNPQQIHEASPEFVKPKPRDEYTPVEIPSGKKGDGSVDASSMKARFELFANPPPKPKVTSHYSQIT